MSIKIKGTFVGKRMEENGNGMAPEFYAYEFIEVEEISGKKLGNKWFKETKLLRSARLQRGKTYEITFDEDFYSMDSVNLPFPTEINWKNGKIYMKNRNSIILVDSKGKETNLSFRSRN